MNYMDSVLDTYEFTNITDPNQNVMLRRRDGKFTVGVVPDNFALRWEDVQIIREFVSSITEKATMEGRYRSAFIEFRSFPDNIPPTVYLATNARNISAVIAYIAAVMILKRMGAFSGR